MGYDYFFLSRYSDVLGLTNSWRNNKGPSIDDVSNWEGGGKGSKIGKNCRQIKFIYSEKATKFCEIFTLLLANFSQNFVAFSENMNFSIKKLPTWVRGVSKVRKNCRRLLWMVLKPSHLLLITE